MAYMYVCLRECFAFRSVSCQRSTGPGPRAGGRVHGGQVHVEHTRCCLKSSQWLQVTGSQSIIYWVSRLISGYINISVSSSWELNPKPIQISSAEFTIMIHVGFFCLLSVGSSVSSVMGFWRATLYGTSLLSMCWLESSWKHCQTCYSSITA